MGKCIISILYDLAQFAVLDEVVGWYQLRWLTIYITVVPSVATVAVAVTRAISITIAPTAAALLIYWLVDNVIALCINRDHILKILRLYIGVVVTAIDEIYGCPGLNVPWILSRAPLLVGCRSRVLRWIVSCLLFSIS